MKIVQPADVQSWCVQGDWSRLTESIGKREVSAEYLENTLGAPCHLRFVLHKLAAERAEKGEGPLPAHALDSISFYSLCKGLFLPLATFDPGRGGQLFGIVCPNPPDTAAREALVARFLGLETGLTLEERLGCVLGDPFQGKKSGVKRDSLVRLLQSVQLAKRSDFLDRLTRAGDIAAVFAEHASAATPGQRETPPLAAAEVLRTLRFLPPCGVTEKFDILRSLLARCTRLEAFFLARLLLRRAGFGFDYQGPLLAKMLAARFGLAAEAVQHALALSDVFHVARILETEGAAGLRKIQLAPLTPIRPALAGGITDELKNDPSAWPVWVERKYDGIRLMLHLSRDAAGNTLCGAYTRTRGDWLEAIAGLENTIKMLGCRSAIVDGELYGTVLTLLGPRPASVYEVYAAIQGEPAERIALKYAAFDLIYLNGHDLTQQPLSQRRAALQSLVAPLVGQPTPIPLAFAEGQLVPNNTELNRLYEHFRRQGYEGIITKNLRGPYLLSARDPQWKKRKPEITLDLAILGVVYAVTSKQTGGLFGSYVIGARRPDGSFEDVGDVASFDALRDKQIQQEISRQGLATGRRIERPSSSGVRPGLEIRPRIVITVKFEGITKDQTLGALKLRDPKAVMIRSDKPVEETDAVDAIGELFLRQRVS